MKRLLVMAAAIMGTCALLTGCGSTTIDLSEYVDVEYTGFDTRATARAVKDSSSMVELLYENVDAEELSFMDAISLEEIVYGLDMTIDESENLQNGDTITVTIEYDEDLAKEWGFKFKNDELEFKVSGLEEAVTLDLFADLIVEYDGTSPSGSVIIRNVSNNSFIQNVSYSSDKSKVANGDEITITAQYMESTALSEGYFILADEQTYTVEGLDEYVTSYDQLDDATITALTSQAEDIIAEKFSSGSSYKTVFYSGFSFSTPNISEVEILENAIYSSYFFAHKEGLTKGYDAVDNSIVLLYKVRTTDTYSEGEHLKYLAIYAKQLIKYSDGTIYFSLNDVKYLNSYDSIADFEATYVASNKASYTYEVIEY